MTAREQKSHDCSADISCTTSNKNVQNLYPRVCFAAVQAPGRTL
ncbi:hypothetical protein GRAN_4158 [Granulicella sibirica]|uniref:Uncharacterized protein n=1 Tax=Granulicella sibirica TaxID=2479048 RepID=A0A4V1L5A2_9BACT|nr:hypothetical protein GRAN_4158 [Granulicella sibirica]